MWNFSSITWTGDWKANPVITALNDCKQMQVENSR